MRTTLGGLPAGAEPLLKSHKVGLVAAYNTGYHEEDLAEAARTPGTVRLPWYLLESRASSATPASLEMVLLDRVMPISGISATRRQTVRSASP